MIESASVEVTEGSERPNISFNGRLLYSESSTPERRVEGLPAASQAVYLVLSPLFFYGIRELISLIPADSHIVAIERDPLLFKLSLESCSTDFGELLEYHLLDDTNPDLILHRITAKRVRKIIPVKLNMGYMLNRKYYDSFIAAAEHNIRNFWKNRMTTIHMGRLWCGNIFKNLPHLRNAHSLSALTTDKPVICAGAGESLDFSIPFIVQNRKSFFIVTADTAVSPLLLNGVKPDLIVVVEAQHANLPDFYTDGAMDLPVAADLTSSPELIRKLKGPVYFFISDFDDSVIFSRLKSFDLLPALLPPLGSVGIYTLLIAEMLTSSDIFFTGLDFCFKPDKYHSSGAPSEVYAMRKSSRTNPAGFFSSAFTENRSRETDKINRIVYTDLVMKSYLAGLQNRILNSGRFHDIGICGLKNNADRCSEEQALRIAGSCSVQNGLSADHKTPEVILRPDNAYSLISEELIKIHDASAGIVAFRNSNGSDSASGKELLGLLEQLDYLWLFFPDNTALPNLDSSFLKRLLFSAAWFERQLKNVLTLL